MKKLKCEILIIGGGLIGLVTAYSLALLGYKIIIIEKKLSLQMGSDFRQGFTPS